MCRLSSAIFSVQSTSEMASVLINNTSQFYLESVFGMENEGMVKMFKALEYSGLKGFLGCSSMIYEAALVEFFQNASVRDDKVVSTVQGKSVEFTEEVFDGTFELPTKGLTDMSDVPKDSVFDARTAFSYDGEQLKTSSKNREMKFEFRLLNDILAKTVIVKSGSFDAVTHERFLMMSAIHGGVKVVKTQEKKQKKKFDGQFRFETVNSDPRQSTQIQDSQLRSETVNSNSDLDSQQSTQL
ncbi:hypothetical protein F511_19538 [Dorcoceras hygrometricum]|uniref:Mucin-2-like n=1 Tax=Dorcoceras hygrometricum TaxID=472368 RepID=A0A2Z7BTD3_9LAMI|nr:hypothetical protein F511_19538 [Dorcoceras hygrometricum]